MNSKQYEQLIAGAIRHEIGRIRDDPVYFVERYVKIEDKGSETGEIIVPFKLWQAQKDALLSIDSHKFNIILKARQLGLSWLCLSYVARYMLINPGCLIIALSRSESEAKELVRRLSGVIFKYMPELVNDTGGKGRYAVSGKALDVRLTAPNGMVSKFSAFPSGKGAGRSFTADILFLDEWAFQQFANEIWASALPTINRPNGGKVIGISTIERGTLFEELWTTDNNFNKMFIPWYADPRRTPEWYEETKSILGDSVMAEYPATPEEALTIPGGAFFPEFREEVHCKPYVDRGGTRFVSFDYGLDGLAVLWYELAADGRVQVYRELYESDMNHALAIQAVKKANCGESIKKWFAPPDLWNRRLDTGKSTAAVFKAAGIPLTRTSNVLEQGWLNVKDWLRVYEVCDQDTGELRQESMLTVDPEACPNLVRCLKKIQKDKHRPNITAHDPHELTHLPDSLRAFCQGRPKTDVPKVTEERGDFDKWLKPKKENSSYVGGGEVIQVI